MSITAVGTVAYDSISTPSGVRNYILGGSATYFSLASSGFAQTKLVSVVGEDFQSSDRELFESHAIDLQDLSVLSGKTFHWEGRYNDSGQPTTITTDLNVLQSFNPVLSSPSSTSPYLFLANIDPDLQLQVLRQMANRPKLVVGDTMNYWIESKSTSLWEVIKKLDVLIINEEEVRLLTDHQNIIAGSRKILKQGISALIIKRGEHGSMAIYDNSYFAVPAIPLDNVIDPTGAGDSFAGGFLGYTASSMPFADLDPEITFKRAMLMGTVMASLAVENFGTTGIQRIAREKIINRFRMLEEMMQIINLTKGKG
mgnify:CR=1 FL=1